MSEGTAERLCEPDRDGRHVRERPEAPGAVFGVCRDGDGERAPGVGAIPPNVATGRAQGVEHRADGSGEDGSERALWVHPRSEERRFGVGYRADLSLDLVEVCGLDGMRAQLAVDGAFTADASNDEERGAVPPHDAPDDPSHRTTAMFWRLGRAERHGLKGERPGRLGDVWALGSAWTQGEPEAIQDNQATPTRGEHNGCEGRRRRPRKLKNAVHTERVGYSPDRGLLRRERKTDRVASALRIQTAGQRGSPESREPW